MQLPKFNQEASGPTTPSDNMNRRFMEAISKPVNRSVFGLLSFIRGKGNKAFSNLTKTLQREFGTGKKIETKPISSNKPIENFYSKEEQILDEKQNESLDNIENVDSKQEDLLSTLIKQSKLTNNLLEEIRDKPVEGESEKDEQSKTASGSTIPGSMLKGAGQMARGLGKVVPGKAGKILRRLGAKSYGLGRKLNNVMGVSSGVVDEMQETATGTTPLNDMLGGKQPKGFSGRMAPRRKARGKLGKLLPGVSTLGAGIGGLSMLGGADSNYGDILPSSESGIVDIAPTLADAAPVGKGITKMGEKAVGKTAAKGAGKTGLKAATKTAGKALGKSLLKKIPGVGLIAGLGFGIDRLMSGDIMGAVGEVASGAASTIPGVGTAVSAAIDAGLAVKDIASASNEELPPQEELGEVLNQQIEQSPEVQKISASEPDMPIAEQQEAIANIQKPIVTGTAESSNDMGSMLKNVIKYSSPIGFIGSTIAEGFSKPKTEVTKETSGSSLGSMLSTAAKFTPMGMLGHAISGGMESLTGINPIKEMSSAFDLTPTDESKTNVNTAVEKAIPVKIVSGDMSESIATEMKESTLKDKTSSFNSSNTIVNAPSSISYENNSAGEEPSMPMENITMEDPYMMQAVRGNYSMSP